MSEQPINMQQKVVVRQNYDSGCGCGMLFIIFIIWGLFHDLSKWIDKNPELAATTAVVVIAVAIAWYVKFGKAMLIRRAAQKQQTTTNPVQEPATPLQSTDQKVCPQCAESVQAAAKICRFCRHEF